MKSTLQKIKYLIVEIRISQPERLVETEITLPSQIKKISKVAVTTTRT